MSVVACLLSKWDRSKKLQKTYRQFTSDEYLAKVRLGGYISETQFGKIQELIDTLEAKQKATGGSPFEIEIAEAKKVAHLVEQRLQAKSIDLAERARLLEENKIRYNRLLKNGAASDEAAISIIFDNPALKMWYGDKSLSLETRMRANEKLYSSYVTEALTAMKPEVFGLMKKKSMSDEMIKDYKAAASGGQRSTNKEIVKYNDQMMKLTNRVFNDLKARGVYLPFEIKDYLLSATFNARKVKRFTEDEFVEKASKINWDWDTLNEAIPGIVDSAAKRERFLRAKFKEELTGNPAEFKNLVSSGFVRVAKSREFSRLLKFKDAESAIAFHDIFGETDFFGIVEGFIERSAKEMALLETVGRSPTAFFADFADYIAKRDPKGSVKAVQKLREGLEYYTTGSGDSVSNAMTAISNTATSTTRYSLLGAHSISGVVFELTGLGAMSRSFRGIPALEGTNIMFRDLKTLDGKGQRQVAAELGMLTDFLKREGDSFIRSSAINGVEKASQIAARATETVFMADKITEKARLINTMAFRNTLAKYIMGDRSDPTLTKALGFLFAGNPDQFTFKSTLTRFGIEDVDIDIIKNAGMRKIDYDGVTIDTVDPSLLFKSGDPKLAELARKLIAVSDDLIYTGSPQSNPQFQRFYKEIARSGNPLTRTVLFSQLFTGYMSDFWRRNVYTMLRAPGSVRKMAFVAAGATYLTAIGMIDQQIRNVILGQDLQPINQDLALRGFVRGGVAPYVGDLFLSAGSGYNEGIVDRFFAMSGLIEKPGKLAYNIFQKATGEKDVNLTKSSLDVAKMLTPGQAGWFTSLLFRRYLWDQLYLSSDPKKARKSFKAQKRTLKDTKESKFYWEPGELSPKRAPGFTNK